MTAVTAQLLPTQVPSAPTGVALVIHGGSVRNLKSVRPLQVAVLRLRPVARSIARTSPDVAVYRLQLTVRGWNGNGRSAIADGRWALAEIARLHPGLPVVLVGHSMGGRIAMRLSGDPAVVGVVGLAPWLEDGEPLFAPTGLPVRIIHGTGDRIVPEQDTREFIARAIAAGVRIDKTVIAGTAHGMLRKWRRWHRLTAEAVASMISRVRA